MSHKENDKYNEYEHERMIEEGGPVSPDRGRYVGKVDDYITTPRIAAQLRRVYSDELAKFNKEC